MTRRIHYATPQEFLRSEPRTAIADCDLCGWETYRCSCTRYTGECDFGGCTRPASLIAVQGHERRPLCHHDIEFARSLGYDITTPEQQPQTGHRP